MRKHFFSIDDLQMQQLQSLEVIAQSMTDDDRFFIEHLQELVMDIINGCHDVNQTLFSHPREVRIVVQDWVLWQDKSFVDDIELGINDRDFHDFDANRSIALIGMEKKKVVN